MNADQVETIRFIVEHPTLLSFVTWCHLAWNVLLPLALLRYLWRSFRRSVDPFAHGGEE